MALNSARVRQFPAFYNHHLLTWRRQRLGLTVRDVATALDRREATIYEVFKGTAKSSNAYPVAQFLELDWAMVHDLDLPKTQYHLAVIPRKVGKVAGYNTERLSMSG